MRILSSLSPLLRAERNGQGSSSGNEHFLRVFCSPLSKRTQIKKKRKVRTGDNKEPFFLFLSYSVPPFVFNLSIRDIMMASIDIVNN